MNNLQKEAYKIRLTPDEKAAMKARIFGVPAPSPYVRQFSIFNFQFSKMLVPVLAVLVVLFGTGTAYAAEGSLPGDILYPVKIHINEPVEVALASTPAAKATVEAKLAERRVAEAQMLASQGKLDATTTAELQSDFKEHEAHAIALANTADNNEATTSEVVSITVTTTTTMPAAPMEPKAAALRSHVEAEATTSTTTDVTSTPEQEGRHGLLREQLQTSLDAQAGILNTLQVDIQQHGDIRPAGRRGRGGQDGNGKDGGRQD